MGEAPLAGCRRRRVGRRSGGAGSVDAVSAWTSARGRRVGHRVIVARVASSGPRRPRPRHRRRGGRRMATLDSSHRESPEPRPSAPRPVPPVCPTRPRGSGPAPNASAPAPCASRWIATRRSRRATTRPASGSSCATPQLLAERVALTHGDRRPGPRPASTPSGPRRSTAAEFTPMDDVIGLCEGLRVGLAERPRARASSRWRPRRSTRRSAATAGIAGSPATRARRTPCSSCSTRAADR